MIRNAAFPELRCAQCIHNNNNNYNAFQPGLGACGASVSSPGKLVLSDLIWAGNRQMMNVRQDHIVPYLPRLANMAWTFDLAKHHAFSQPVISLSAHMSVPPEPCSRAVSQQKALDIATECRRWQHGPSSKCLGCV